MGKVMISFRNRMRALAHSDRCLHSWYDVFIELTSSLLRAASNLSAGDVPPIWSNIEESRKGLSPFAEPEQVTASGLAAQRAVAELAEGLIENRNIRERELKKIIRITAEAGVTMARAGLNHAEEIRQFASRVEMTSHLESVIEIRRQMSKRLEELDQMARRMQESSAQDAALLSREINRIQERLAVAEKLADTDALTRLGNRRLLERLIAGQIAKRKQFCIVLVDLNGFKLVNDKFGHAQGDRVLQVVAKALTAAVREGDVLGRWGGDEFMIVLRGIGLADAEARVSQIQNKVFGEFLLDDGPHPIHLNVSACFGIAEYRSAESADDLFERADRQLYQLKRSRHSHSTSSCPPMPPLVLAR